VHYDFIESVKSKWLLNEQGNSDVVEALQRLGQLDQIQQQARYEQLTVVQLP
jgi:hypothetical protein